MVYRAGDGAENVVPGGDRGRDGHPAPPRPGQRGGLPALVRGPRDRPAGALPGDADAARGDRALLRGPGRRTGRPGDGRPRAGDGPAHRDVRVQPARRRERLGAVPHHDRRAGRLGARLRHRGDPADGRPRVRHARPAPDRAVRVRVQRARDPRLPALRLRHRGPLARIDLARRPLVGRAGDERPRIGLAGREHDAASTPMASAPATAARRDGVEPVAAGPSDLLRRTFGRFR